MANDTLAIFGYRRPEERAELTPLQEALKADAAAARRRIAEGKADPATAGDELEEQYFLAQERVRETASAKIRVFEKRWRSERDPTKELLNLTRWGQKYGLMDDAELGQEISRYITDPKRRDPDQVDSLLAAAVKAGHQDVGVLRRAMADNRYDQPWLEDCPELVAMTELHSAPYGRVRVMSGYGLDDWPIRELLEGEEEL